MRAVSFLFFILLCLPFLSRSLTPTLKYTDYISWDDFKSVYIYVQIYMGFLQRTPPQIKAEHSIADFCNSAFFEEYVHKYIQIGTASQK